MEKNRSHMTDRILDLTLEIIYLLTGEECIIEKKTSGRYRMHNSFFGVSQKYSRKQSPKTRSLISERKNYEKILEVTKKIIELLTGEEWEYLEGHKDLYKDAKMENRPPVASPDGSRNRNTPERWPRPLYSWDSTREHQEIPHEDQSEEPVKIGVKEEAEEPTVMGDELCKKEIPAETSADTRTAQTDIKAAEREEGHVRITCDHNQGDCVSNMKVRQKEEKICVNAVVRDKEKHVPTDGPIGKNTQQECVNLLSFRNSAKEHDKVSYDDQCELQSNVKTRETERAEDSFLRTDVLKQRECPSNFEVKEKEENRILRTGLQKEKRERRLNAKDDVMDSEDDTFLRTGIQRNERHLNFKPEITERQEKKLLRPGVLRKKREVSVQTFSSRITPKRCPSPLYHWNSIGEHQKVIRDEKGEQLLNIKMEVMDSDDESYLWRDPMCKEEDVSTDGSNNRNTPERCRSPLYSWDSTPENHKILSSYQEESPSPHQARSRASLEKRYGREQRKEDEIPPEIGSDGRYTGFSTDKCPMIFPDGEMEDDVTGDSFEDAPIGANLYTVPHRVGQSSGPSTHASSFRSHLPPVTYRASRRRGETFMCSECGECFTAKAKLFKHQRDHIVDKPHSCPDCGKCFVEKSHLVNHQRSHSVEKPYSCSICGKCFGEKGHLANHEKSHTNEKEFFCYDCGKCFTQRGHFNRHQRLHTGEKPYPCPECGKRFPHKEYLIRHQRVHAGQKPFPCSECGKCFTDKYDLAKHERIHSGHRPYSCAECGRGFTQKSNLARHVRVHADYNRIHVLTVGNGSPGDPPSSTISVPTGDERFLYQDMTAE